MLLMEKSLEDNLKELYLEAERTDQQMILTIHKWMMRKLWSLKSHIIETNAGVQLIVKEYMQAEINGDLYKENGIKNEFL